MARIIIAGEVEAIFWLMLLTVGIMASPAREHSQASPGDRDRVRDAGAHSMAVTAMAQYTGTTNPVLFADTYSWSRYGETMTPTVR